MWQQRAQLLPALSPSRANLRMRKEQAQILFQSAVDGILKRKRQNSRNELCRDAGCERADSGCSRNSLARSARTRYCLGLRQGCCRPTNQNPGPQKDAAAFVTESQGSLLLIHEATTCVLPQAGRMT